MPSGALPPGATDNKRQRELYVGNLTVGAVTAQMLKELFAVPLSTIPGHDPAIPPVRAATAQRRLRGLQAACAAGCVC